MITQVRRQGGWRWLTALLISCLVVMVAGWRLASPTDRADEQLVVLEDASAATPSLPTPSASRGRGATQARAERAEPGEPRMMAIPRLDLKMPITAVTVDDNGAMAIPARPSEIGWYVHGPRPGSAHGSAVLGGHVDSREYGVGPLVGLKQLRRGDDIIIKTTTGSERFRVSTVRLISKQNLDLRMVFKREGEPLLRILTCGGTYRRSGGYQANVVVTARPA
ncbi:MAG TPA: class F sortase [Propionibacteriaceae bacterium]|nr:class F sortase [Propionibacteriaceae bacterium]